MRQVDEQPPPLPPEVPGPVRQLIGRAVAKNPEFRFTDGAAFAAASRRLLADTPEAARWTTTAPIREAATAVPADEPPTSEWSFELLPADADPGPTDEATSKPPRPMDLATRRRRRLVRIGLSGAALLAAVLLVIQPAAHRGHPHPAAMPAQASSGTSARAVSPRPDASAATPVTASDLIGRSIDLVRAQLTTAGLQVQLNGIPTGALPAGQVTDITPTGQLTAGQTVRVSYAQSP
jgi:serine/threonine-protein kinase